MPEATDQRLLLIVERIERLLEERRGISEDIRDVYAEAKAVGYDTGMIRRLIGRRAMKPDDRAEADQMLEVYEAAVGMTDGTGLPSIEDLRPDAAVLAAHLLTEEIVGLEDPERARLLVDHVLYLLDLRAEIALLRSQESARKALAKAEGFDVKQVAVTVHWFEKCAKHGPDAMRLGEETFHLYRATVNGPASGRPVSEDSKLAAMFAPPRAKKGGDRMADVLAGIAASKGADQP